MAAELAAEAAKQRRRRLRRGRRLLPGRRRGRRPRGRRLRGRRADGGLGGGGEGGSADGAAAEMAAAEMAAAEELAAEAAAEEASAAVARARSLGRSVSLSVRLFVRKITSLPAYQKDLLRLETSFQHFEVFSIAWSDARSLLPRKNMRDADRSPAAGHATRRGLDGHGSRAERRTVRRGCCSNSAARKRPAIAVSHFGAFQKKPTRRF